MYNLIYIEVNGKKNLSGNQRSVVGSEGKDELFHSV